MVGFGLGLSGSGGGGSFFGAGSFIAIALRTLIPFSSGRGGADFCFSSSRSLLLSSAQSSRSVRFLNLDPPCTAPICIFHLPLPTPLAPLASSTVSLAFCSLDGDGESMRVLLLPGSSDSLRSLLKN